MGRLPFYLMILLLGSSFWFLSEPVAQGNCRRALKAHGAGASAAGLASDGQMSGYLRMCQSMVQQAQPGAQVADNAR